MDKCPKCGMKQLWSDSRPGLAKCGFEYGTFENHLNTLCESDTCLRHQLAAANAKIAEMARLAEDTRANVEVLTGELAAANERAGRLEGEREELRRAWPHIVVAHLMDTNDDEIEAEATFTRILGGA